MSLLTVVGIGNRLCGDDGVGNEVAQTLSEINTDERILYVVGETDIDYCLSQVQTPHIIIIDAVQAGRQPGSIQVMRLGELSMQNISGITMHDQHLLTIIRNSKKTGLLIGIEPCDLSLQINLSELLISKFQLIVDSINTIILNYLDNI